MQIEDGLHRCRGARLGAVGRAILIVIRPATWLPLTAIALVAALAGPGVAGAALSWSSAISVDGLGGSSLSGVACPSATLCVAVDAANREVSFDPLSPGVPTPVRIAAGVGGLAAVACASVNECTAVSKYEGKVVTFDPSSPTPSSAGSLDNGSLLGIACPSVSQCTAVDSEGYESSFDQSMLGTFVSPVELNHAGGGPIACPSATECVVVPNTDELTFDPTTVAQGPVGQPVTISSGSAVFDSIACPSTGQCTAVDFENHEVTFDPMAPAPEPAIAIDGAGNSMSGVACPSASQCTAVDGHGREVTFDPSAQTSGSRALAPVSIEDDNLNGKPHALNGVACPLPSQCTAVDGGGQEVTFDPQSPGAPTPVEIDPNKTVHKLGAVACPSRSQCTALDASGRAVTFDPRRRRPLGLVTIDPRAKNDASSAFACPSTKQCTATGADDFTEVTFDPPSPRTPTWFTIAQAVGGLVGIACPSVTQCTGVDAQGEEVTCDPRARCLPRWVTIEPYRLRDLACPSTIQCTAVNSHGVEVTFDPRSPRPAISLRIDRAGLNLVACPSTSQCTAIDAQGRELTFDPRSHGRPLRLGPHAGVGGVSALACPSARVCVAVDGHGNVYQGDPNGPERWRVERVDPGRALDGVACSSASECVAVDAFGNAFVGLGRG
jgi:hypothetical protein